jgi:hypothetical protein
MQRAFILRLAAIPGDMGRKFGAATRMWLCGNAPSRRALKPRYVRVKGTPAFDGRLMGSGPRAIFVSKALP